MLDLLNLRQNIGLTQEELASKCGISRQFYNFIERGHRRPSPEAAKRIANALGFPDEWYRLLEFTPTSMIHNKRQKTAN